MKTAPSRAVPSWRSVAAEQFRAVGIAILPPVAVAGTVVVAAAVYVCLAALRYGEGIGIGPEQGLFIALVAPFFPVIVWKGERPIAGAYLASLPVGRTGHMLVKVAAGWAWLMILVASFLLLMLAVASATGGEIGIYTGAQVADRPRAPSLTAATVVARRWPMPVWLWASFFTSATVAYLFGSAILLAGRRTRRWLAAALVACALIFIADSEGIRMGGGADGLKRAGNLILDGRLGLRTLVLGVRARDVLSAADAGETTAAWHLHIAGRWATTAALWIGLAGAGVAGAVVGRRTD